MVYECENLKQKPLLLILFNSFQLALKDIEEALSLRPCQELRSSILKTHKLCLSEMRRQSKSQSPCRSPHVANRPHESIASASDLVKVNYKKEKGRYLEVCLNVLNEILY